MNCSEEDVPNYIKRQSIQKDIQALLGTDVSEEDENSEVKKFDPYSLDALVHPHLESKFRHGIKEPAPAYKNTKSASKSMFECEVIRFDGDRISTSFSLYDHNSFIKITIPSYKGNYYLLAGRIKELMKQDLHEFYLRCFKTCTSLILKFNVDYDFLKENVRKR